jgi:hypothetical protein
MAKKKKIYPKCKLTTTTHPTLTWDGYVTPCCLLAAIPFQEVKKLVGKKLEQLHISSGTIDEINRSEAMYLIEKSFTENPMEQCKRMCGKPPAEAKDGTEWMDCLSPYTIFKK